MIDALLFFACLSFVGVGVGVIIFWWRIFLPWVRVRNDEQLAEVREKWREKSLAVEILAPNLNVIFIDKTHSNSNLMLALDFEELTARAILSATRTAVRFSDFGGSSIEYSPFAESRHTGTSKGTDRDA